MVYYYLTYRDLVADSDRYNGAPMLKFWIMQLALQLQVLPTSDGLWPLKEDSPQHLIMILKSLLSMLRRTFIFIDGVVRDCDLL